MTAVTVAKMVQQGGYFCLFPVNMVAGRKSPELSQTLHPYQVEKECLVGHLHLLAIAGFTELAIPAMMVLGFQAHPQFAIAETLQWCA
ncbi:hypothetical protein DEO72_LG4g127 [Vigna unguiculata]|uniref:Uncharacterized protein n=1 Tax=Vigna unguiculata TaxID=3917 RepID=A0A4D6LL39_VIGUN|nr:hypothetical protein DEO72_LG4g127 [Vigna unguiculata]